MSLQHYTDYIRAAKRNIGLASKRIREIKQEMRGEKDPSTLQQLEKEKATLESDLGIEEAALKRTEIEFRQLRHKN